MFVYIAHRPLVKTLILYESYIHFTFAATYISEYFKT